ncbi:MAG: thioredoxin family protein [Bacteroidales bacterium]
MLRKISILALAMLLLAGVSTLSAQEEAKAPKKIYNPQADARKEISAAIKKANAGNKHVFIQVGGNWCSWCLLFHSYINEEPEVKKLIEENYVFTLLNFSPENRNIELLNKFGNPGRFGYPVFLILDGKGKLIHTQDSGLLEEGKGYNKSKVTGFLRNWSPAAVNQPAGK